MDNSAENEKHVFHRVTHTTHGRTLNSLQFPTVPTASATTNKKMIDEKKNTDASVDSIKFTVDIFQKKR